MKTEAIVLRLPGAEFEHPHLCAGVEAPLAVPYALDCQTRAQYDRGWVYSRIPQSIICELGYAPGGGWYGRKTVGSMTPQHMQFSFLQIMYRPKREAAAHSRAARVEP